MPDALLITLVIMMWIVAIAAWTSPALARTRMARRPFHRMFDSLEKLMRRKGHDHG